MNRRGDIENIIRSHFRKRGIQIYAYKKIDDVHSTFEFTIHPEGVFSILDYHMVIEGDVPQLIVMAIFPFRPVKDYIQKAQMYEVALRCQQQYVNGRFSIGYKGLLQYETMIECDADAEPTEEHIRRAISVPTLLLEQNGIYFLHSLRSEEDLPKNEKKGR